jgi:hypothetical protein
MESAFPWLIGFCISQLGLMALGSLPPHLWRSSVEMQRPASVGTVVATS